MPRLIDERLCGQLSCTHLLLFHSVVCRSSFAGIVSQCLELPRPRINRALVLFRGPWTERSQKESEYLGLENRAYLFLVKEKILFWEDCSSGIPQTVFPNCTLMSMPVSQCFAQQWSIIRNSYQQFRNNSFRMYHWQWMLFSSDWNHVFESTLF